MSAPSYEELERALQKISQIEDQEWGGDWEEIEHARVIARCALAGEPLPLTAPWE